MFYVFTTTPLHLLRNIHLNSLSYCFNLDEPDCSTPQAIQRSETAAGYFMMETNIQLSTLNQISTIPKCTKLQCAVSCLRHQSCWYYRYEPSASGCSQCTLYDSSVTSWKGTGAGDNFLYKWK